MANTRIKDISTAATTLNSDDFIAVDGSTAGTRKMAKADLISEVSSGVSGTYLEESNNLSDVASLDTSKLNMEIPDVGTAPNEVSLNGMLGDMAFQSSDGVSAGTISADEIGVGVTDPDELIHAKATSSAVYFKSESGSTVGVFGASNTAGAAVSGSTTASDYQLWSANQLRWTISGSTGNLVANGTAIDFGSGATFDNYEHGDITSVTDNSGAGLSITAQMKYQVIGKSVHISGAITFPTTSNTNLTRVTLLPEQCPNSNANRGLSVSYSTTGSAFYALPVGGTNDVSFYTLSGGPLANNALSGVIIFISGNYSLN